MSFTHITAESRMSMAYSGLDDEPDPEKSSANSELMCEPEIPVKIKKAIQLLTYKNVHSYLSDY
jgi:hypothetical protein